ncbi:rod shape-determining protein MreD [Selenomonas sp. TAMA-11512]|uniref:rod shape-determining protein MreD n=1 Tax=Selenomonas sp. TAMA-11512 TaxID=3095337 RepID=UPI0030CD67F4
MRTKKNWLWGVYVLLLYVMQTSFFPFFSWHGIAPDLLLLFVISFSFLKGPRLGVLAAFAVGLLSDLATGTFFGVATCAKMLVAFFCGHLSEGVYRDSFLLTVTTVTMATMFSYAMTYGVMYALGYHFHLIAHAAGVLFPMLIWNLALTYPVHRGTSWMEAKIKAKDE